MVPQKASNSNHLVIFFLFDIFTGSKMPIIISTLKSSHIAKAPVRLVSRYPPREASGNSYYHKPNDGGLLAGNTRSSTATRQHPVPMKCIYCGQAHWSDHR